MQLPPGDAEFRFWVVPAFGPARGVVLRMTGSDLHALVIDKHGSRAAAPSRAIWDALVAEGILTLPDDSALPSDGKYILDGVGYVVEVHHEGAYRSYSYSNPAEHAWPEATHVLRMAHLLARAFQVPIDDRSPEVRVRVPDVDVDTTSHAMGAPCDPLDMMQWSRCGPRGHVAIVREHGGRAACDLQPLPPPNPYAWRACATSNRVYLGSETTVLVADVGEMSDDQRLWLQKKMGIPGDAPLRTIGEWRAATSGLRNR